MFFTLFMYNLGTTHQAHNEPDKAEEFYNLALSQAIYGNDIPGQARVYGNIGNLLMLTKAFDRAVTHYAEVLHLSQDRSTVFTAHHNRGCTYYQRKETKKESFLSKDKEVMGILDQLPTVPVTVPVDNQQMLCVVGNPTTPTFTYNNEEWNLGKLPHATREAEWVTHILNCTPILHEQATKTAVMMRIMNAKVIHLATHGSASAGFLAFTGMSTSFNGPMESKNVLIYPEEIEKLNITPALVVLSSCDSGRGIVKADGIQGMARAFILAGAQAVLNTLWRVPDESAYIFTQLLYQYLADRMKGTEHLYKSILSIRRFSKYLQYIHWSGYQLTGREVQFSINKSSSTTGLCHCTPSMKNARDSATSRNLENKTGNHLSIQSITSNNELSCHKHSTSLLCLPNNSKHLLSDSQRQFHEERITIIAELIHAQDYPRILPLSYCGNPPTNLPPKYLIAYIFSTAVSYYKMGNNKESLVYFQASLDQAGVFERKGDVTLSCVYIGDIEFSQRKFIEAAKQYQTALKNYSRDSVARFLRMVLPSQSALCAKHGSALKNATKVVDAINAYELAIAKAESKKDKLSTHTSLGNLLQSLGENSRAITEYETSIELATALGDFVSLGWVYGNMGNAFLGLYQGEKALHHLEKSLDLTVEHEPSPQAIGRAYNNLGTAHQALNELDKAEEFYDLALGQAIYGNDIPGQARVYGNIGNLLMLKKECDRAVPHYTEVLRLSQDRSTVSTAHHNRGCAYYEWAETKKEAFLNENKDVMPTIKPLLHGPQFEHWEREYRPPFIPENIKKYYTQATKDLDYVIRYHEESVDSIKGSAKGLSLSVSLFESNSCTFHRKQDCLVSTSKFEEALLAAEQSRARTLGELLLKRRGPQLEHQLRSPPSLEQLKLTVALQNSPVVYLSYTGARLLGWLSYPTPSQPSLNMFEVPLSDDEFDGKSFDYHLRYSLNEVLVEKSFEMYTPFKFELSQNVLVRKLYDLVAQPLMAMLQKLKKDAESQETPQKKTQKIIVIPDSYTNLLPLTCLLNKDGKFWGDDHYFQIMPSLLTMGILDQLPTVSVNVPVDNQQMLCVVGNPTIPTFTYNNEEWNLGKLPHATREAEWVSHILNCTPILHEQATKTAVMMRIMNAKVIHLATHGSASAGFLAFAGMTTSFSGPMESKNVLIYPEDIEKLNITPALVVLSSCDSGRGIVKADGIQGMARAFILAGAQAVLTTL